MNQSISGIAVSALRWNYLGFVVRSGSNFMIGILLARLLGPKPFGQLAVVALVIGIANLLADAGFSSALVQAGEVGEVEIRYVFTVQMLIAVGLSLTTASLSGFISEEFHDPYVRLILLRMSPIFVLQAAGQTSSALMRRTFAFKKLQTFQVISYLVSYVGVGIPLAFLGSGVWSLVSAQLLQCVLYSGMSYGFVRHSISPTLSRGNTSLLKFGAKVTLNNVANWGISNLDNTVVGHAYGPVALGLYNRAFSLGNSLSDGVVVTLQQVLFSSCSRAEGRLVPLQRAYLACMSGVAIVILPAFWTMSACSEVVIVGLYGKKWLPAVPLFHPLAFAISIHALMALAGPILQSMNLVEREIRAQAATLVLTVACFLFAVRYSVVTVAWMVVLIYVFRFLTVTAPLMNELLLPWSRLGRTLAGPALVAAIIASAAFGVDRHLGRTGFSPVPRLAVVIMTGFLFLGLIVILGGRFLISQEAATALRLDMSSRPAWFRWVYASAVPAEPDMPPLTRQTPVVLARTIINSAEVEFESAVASALALQGVQTKVLSPESAPAWLTVLSEVATRSACKFSEEAGGVVRLRLKRALLGVVLRRHLRRDSPWVVYATSVDAALAAIPLREGSNQRVVLVTQLHSSEADELVERGEWTRAGRPYRWLREREKVVLSRADGVVFPSEVAEAKAKDTVASAALSPSILLPMLRPDDSDTSVGRVRMHLDVDLLHSFSLGEYAASSRYHSNLLMDIGVPSL